jgi:hypothetical protein
MASKLRYRRGDIKPIIAVWDSTYPIEKGDLLFRDPITKKARPFSSMVDQGSLALNQDTAQELFLGVAHEKVGLQTGETSFNLNTNDGYVVVATAGEFEFDCASYAWGLGDLVAPCEKASGTALENQKVVAVAAGSESKAIGKAVPNRAYLGVANTTIVVAIKSTIMDSGLLQQIAGSSSGTV